MIDLIGMRRWLFGLVVLGVFVGVVVSYLYFTKQTLVISPIGTASLVRPLDKYTIDNLTNRVYSPSQIILDQPVSTESAYTSYLFHFISDTKRVSGVANIPNRQQKKYPVIVQFRGYIDKNTYTPGDGTRNSGKIFATNGFITLAPDFLGYATSASPSADVFEERFETYTTAITLLLSVGSLPQADPSNVGIWAHSNGGHITLTVLEILQKAYPTVLWAPVSKPFPYSILYYTDDVADHGKLLRKELASFEQTYDVELYSLTNYLDRINTTLQIHQGTADQAVPLSWTDSLVKQLKDKGKDVSYYIYPAADHDMNGAWNTVMSRDVDFFTKHLKG